MADLKAKLEEIKATIAAESAEVAEAVADLGGKIDELKAALEAGTVEKEALLAELDVIKAGVEGIFTKTVEPVE
jgi:predicted  nucleic acid-binding Zn-ribbon protein